MIELIVSSRTIDQESAELVAVSFFENERPLRSAVGYVDSRIGGLISRRIEQGFMTGELGEITLIPANGRIEADKILVVGLGDVAGFSYGKIRELAEQVVKACLGLRIHELVLALPNPLHFGLEWAKLAEAMVEGIGHGLKRGSPHHDIRLRLLGGSDFYDQILRGAEIARRILKNPFPIKVRRESSSD